MRQAKYTGVILAAVLLTLFCGCGNTPASDAEASGAASSSASAASETPVLYCGEIELHWEIPQYEYTILDTAAGEESFAALYIERRVRDGNPDSEPYLFLMAQFFNAQGDYEQTAYTGIYGTLDRHDFAQNGLRLTYDKLYIDRGEDLYNCVERETGIVSQWRYEVLAQQNGATLSYSGEYSDQVGIIGMRYRLKTTDGSVFVLAVPEFDDNFNMALDFMVNPEYADREGVTFVATAELDAAAKTAVLSNTKLTYTLDFNDLSYTYTRRYTDEMLEEVLATSPDGAAVLYEADSGGAGDAFWRDVVVKTNDGSITFLDFCSVLYGSDFFDNDTVVLNEAWSLKTFDLTGKTPVERQLIDLGTVTEPYGGTHPEREIIGMAIDHRNQMLLITTRDYSDDWDALLPVTLTVFDASLKQTGEIKTDCRIISYHHNWPMPCDITLNGDGTANLSWMEEEPVRVRYLD